MYSVDGSYTWMVPVSISAASNPKKPAVITLLDKPTQEVTVPNVKPDEWVKVVHNFIYQTTFICTLFMCHLRISQTFYHSHNLELYTRYLVFKGFFPRQNIQRKPYLDQFRFFLKSH